MKEIFRLSMRCLMMMAGATVVTVAFAAAVLGDILWLSVLMTAMLLVVILYLGLTEGAVQARKDLMFQSSMERQEKERGLAPTEEEKTRFFKKYKGFAAAYLAASPGILLSLFMLFVPESSVLYSSITPIVRFVLGVYLGVFGHLESLMPFAYLPLSLLMPTAMGLGYLFYGPMLYQKMMKQVADARRRRRRRRKKAQPKNPE